MKKILLLILICSNNLWSQSNDFNTYELDSIISVNIPGENVKIDSLENNEYIIQIYSKIGNSEFTAQKELFVNDNINAYDSYLSYDLKSLEKQYKILVNEFINDSNYKLKSENLIEKDNYKGYHLKFTDSLNNSIYEIEYFLFNKNIYSFFYKNTAEFDKNDIELFFNSIKINSSKNISQFSGKSPSEKSAYNLGYKIGHALKKHPSYLWMAGGIILIFIIGIIVFFVKRK